MSRCWLLAVTAGLIALCLTSVAGDARVTFGVEPDGNIGLPNPPGTVAVPWQPKRMLRAIHRLRGNAPFVIHLYKAYHNHWTHLSRADLDLIRLYTHAGLGVEEVLRYQPVAVDGDPAGYAAFVGHAVRRLARTRGVVAVQVVNEADDTLDPGASDGAFPQVLQAIGDGLIAAHQAAQGRLPVGINFDYNNGLPHCTPFFQALGTLSPKARRAVDYVGVDYYPGAFGWPATALSQSIPAAWRTALTTLRYTLMPLAGLRHATIRVTESGYPQNAALTLTNQVIALRGTLKTVEALARRLRITDYRFFDLSDQAWAGGTGYHYGLMWPDFKPKPMFFVYRRFIRRLGK